MIASQSKDRGVSHTRGSISKLSIEDNLELKVKDKG